MKPEEVKMEDSYFLYNDSEIKNNEEYQSPY
jgi:hypothetical protein